MTRAEGELVEAIRDELAAVDPPRRCCRAAESAGLAGAFEPRRRPIVRVALRMIRGRAPGEMTGAAAAAVAAAAGAAVAIPAFAWAGSAEHCRAAWLRGRFLAHGSLSLASGRTHLEFVVPVDEAPELCERLSELEMAASWRVRRGRGVVTWKSSETVGTFLRFAGAGSALLELEARQVSRSVRGDLNRVINAESANLQRAVEAAARQLEAIDTIEGDGRLTEQPDVVRLVANARREEPEATLSQLAERTGLHRSAVQRALERMEHLALHPDQGVGKRSRRARSRA
jgi:DNA-binding transcriptional regulator WhiA